ncbi:alpha/beta fold hydrolase [Polynucleobacter sp. MWH-UH2A]|uniref:alpha/beta fold hydrolase n=1 Tax=Polynucleobacter sp. MWH-UH2A TaxID=1855617 RepID=UPI001BFEB7AC|nr:alpha/beta hydrolase [Polynucleobacter sp. MWH-UH2A]QWD64052.1 alpha/beta hydrolase [Polynucleobacter sp. MWH-UH2A]
MNHYFIGIRTLVGLSFVLLLVSFGFAGPVQAQFKAEVKYAQVGEVRLAYYTRGQGDAMILINGYSATMSMWDPALIDELSKNNTLILFDNRGIGLSGDTKENKTTMVQMADDAAGLVKALGYKKANVLGWSMGARVAQQFLIRHSDLVIKGILCAPNPGGKYQVKASKKTEEELNNPHLSVMENVALLFPNNEAGKQAAKDALAREQAAKLAGTIPDDFVISKESKLRQTRARTTLWDADNKNFVDLKNVKVPVLVADGQYDILDVPKNSQIIANQIPFAWLAYFDGGHAFLFQQHQKFAETLNAFMR